MFNKIKAVIIGHAIGDALGVPVEFATREELDNAPLETMEGFGTYPMPKGSWSDDTSMALATLEALIPPRHLPHRHSRTPSSHCRPRFLCTVFLNAALCIRRLRRPPQHSRWRTECRSAYRR